MMGNATSTVTAFDMGDPAQESWREWLVLAGLAFTLFVVGAGVILAALDSFGFGIWLLAAVINPPLMLPICGLTAVAMEVGASSDVATSRRRRVGLRTLRFASIYWAAAGGAFIVAPVLVFIA